jgi:hypothetical protein
MTAKQKKQKRCVCGQPMPHPKVPPGTPWTWHPHPENLPDEVIAAGHCAHVRNEWCECTICHAIDRECALEMFGM